MRALLFFAISSLAGLTNAQIISSDGLILGYDFDDLDFKQADSILELSSYKEPLRSFRSIRWRNGGCSIIYRNTYFIKQSGEKLQFSLRGAEDHFRLVIVAKRRTKKIKYDNVILGRTKFHEIKLNFDKADIDIGIDKNGTQYFAIPYKKLMLAADGSREELNSDDWKNKIINKFIWQK